MSKKRCSMCGKDFNQEEVMNSLDEFSIKKFSDGKGGIDRCLSCIFKLPNREEECQQLKAGDGQRDFFDAEHDIHPDDNYDEEMREINSLEQQFHRRF